MRLPKQGRTEAEIFDHFQSLTVDKIAILISHRFSTVRRAELIVVMDEGEIIELTVPEKPQNEDIIELPLKELDFPKGALMGAVIRDDEVTLATGNTVLAPGDQILVVAATSAIREVEELLE